MSFIKLEGQNKELVDQTYIMQDTVIEMIHKIEGQLGKERWLSIGRTDIEKGFMALRKGITELYLQTKPS